jgi:hypothetical protein
MSLRIVSEQATYENSHSMRRKSQQVHLIVSRAASPDTFPSQEHPNAVARLNLQYNFQMFFVSLSRPDVLWCCLHTIYPILLQSY